MVCTSWQEQKQSSMLVLLTTFSCSVLVSIAGLSVGSVNNAVHWKREVLTLGETVLHMLSGIW